MKNFTLRTLVILSAFLLCSCEGGKANRADIALRTCLFQANYNYQERRESVPISILYKKSVDLCYAQRNACNKDFRSSMCAAFIRKYPN